MTPAKDHIETELLLRYVEGKTDTAETRKVELHLAECALCDEALDGLMLAKDMDMVRADLSQIDNSLTVRFAKKLAKGKVNIWRWLAAASVLCVLGLGLYQLTSGDQKTKEIAQREETNTATEKNAQQPSVPPIADSQILADNELPLKKEAVLPANKQVSPAPASPQDKIPEIVAMQEDVQPSKSLSKTTLPSRSTTASPIAPAAPKPYVAADETKDKVEIIADAVGTSKKDSKIPLQNSPPVSSPPSVASKPVPSEYDDAKYLAAESLSDSKTEQEDLMVLEKKAKPAKSSANYTQAQKLFRQKNYSEAAVLLEQVPAKSPDYEAAQRLLEKCYRKLGNVAAADDIQRSLNAKKNGKNSSNTQPQPAKTDKK